MKLSLGVKSDPVEYRFSFPWLFRLMADEGVTQLQLGSFFELYQLPDSYFQRLRRQAADFGISIDSLFTAHRELGGFFREDPEWTGVARRNFERFIEVGALLGARSVGSNPGAVPRDLMGLKEEGTRRYLDAMQELMGFAHDHGVQWLTVEPMSCLAEPPTVPDEIAAMGRQLDGWHAEHPETTARAGYCVDIAHGYINAQGERCYDHVELFEAALPWLYEVHLKNTDGQFHSTFGFGEEERRKGIVDVGQFRDLLHARAAEVPVDEVTGYLEIGGPKLGRDNTDWKLEDQLKVSLRHLREVWLASPALPSGISEAASARPAEIRGHSGGTGIRAADEVAVAPSMMCVDPLNFESALRRVEALGVDLLHMDVMDARFVPNMPMGLGVIHETVKRTRLPVDVHLMVADNDFFVEQLATSGVYQISIHAESAPHLDRTLARIREMGAKAGVALNPATPLEELEYVLERLDYVLVMTVNPGFAGQKLTPASIRKIADCRQFLDAHGYERVPIQVDGNVSFEHVPGMVRAGARCLVAGTSSLFSASADWTVNLGRLHQAIAEGLGGDGETRGMSPGGV